MQEYKLTSFEKSDYQDAHGNYWCSATFEGVGEPVKWVAKDPTKVQVGQEYFGEIKDMTSKAGKPYLRFYRANKPDGQAPSSGASSASTSSWQPRDDSAIRAQFAIKAAVDLLKDPSAEVAETTIEHWAIIFYKMVDRVKEAGADKPAETAPIKEAERSLAEMFRNRNDSPAAQSERVDVVHEVTDEPINLNDIPF